MKKKISGLWAEIFLSCKIPRLKVKPCRPLKDKKLKKDLTIEKKKPDINFNKIIKTLSFKRVRKNGRKT